MSLSKLRAQDHYKAVTRELVAAGLKWRVEHRGKHYALVIDVNGREEVEILSATPSDWRSVKNAAGHIRRRIRNWMAETGTLAIAPVPAEFQTLEKETMDDNTFAGELRVVEFRNTEIETIEVDGVPRVALKPIVDGMGLDWNGQLQRAKRDPVLSEGMCVTPIPSQGGVQEAVTIPLRMLNGFLFGISVSRVKKAIQPAVLDYQRKCYEVLADHWMPETKSSQSAPAALEGMHLDLLSLKDDFADLRSRALLAEDWALREKNALEWFGDALVKSLAKHGIGLSREAVDAIGRAAGGAAKKVIQNKKNWEDAGVLPVPHGDEHEYRTTFELLTLIIDADKVHSRLTSWVTNEILMPAARDGFWPQGRTPVRSRSDRPSVTFPLLRAKEHLLRKDVRKAVVAKNDGFWRGAQSGVVVGLFDGAQRP